MEQKHLTIDSMRQMLWEQALGVREGKVKPADANAITNLNGCILRSVKLQMEYARDLGITPTIPIMINEGEGVPKKLAAPEG